MQKPYGVRALSGFRVEAVKLGLFAMLFVAKLKATIACICPLNKDRRRSRKWRQCDISMSSAIKRVRATIRVRTSEESSNQQKMSAAGVEPTMLTLRG